MAGMESYPRYSQSKYEGGEVLSAYETGSEARFRSKSCEGASCEGDGECLRLGVKPS